MDFSYSRLFSLKILNGFFRDNICRGLQVIPSDDTATLLKQYDILLREQGNEFVLLVNDGWRDHFVDNYYKEKKSLEFLVYSQDPFFKNYTAFSGTDYINTVSLFSNEPGSDLLKSVEGCHTVFRNKKPGGRYNALIPAGCIIIHPDEAYLQNLRTGETPLSHTAQFSSRQLTWKYIISNRRGLTINDPAIIDNLSRKKTVFGDPSSIVLPNGDKALLFVSNNEMTLTERANVIFQLVKNYGGSFSQSESIITHLTNASPDSIRYDASGKQWFAEIYVHI